MASESPKEGEACLSRSSKDGSRTPRRFATNLSWAAELGVHTQVVPDAGPIQVPALGWLGTTAGISDKGQFVAVMRFESEVAAR